MSKNAVVAQGARNPPPLLPEAVREDEVAKEYEAAEGAGLSNSRHI